MKNSKKNSRLASADYAEPLPEEEKKKKKKIILIIIFIFLIIAIAASVSTGVLFGMKKNSPVHYLSVTIDPVIVNQSVETHIDGAENFNLDLTNGSTDFTKNLNVHLISGQYFKYLLELKNGKTDQVNWSLSLKNLENDGFNVTYIIDEEEIEFPADLAVDGEIYFGQTKKIEIIFKMSDNELISGRIAGSLTFTATMVEV